MKTTHLILLLSATVACFSGCTTTGLNEGDAALLARDLRDVAHVGTVYALAENPAWRANIALVRDQLRAAATQTEPLTFDALLSTLQGLPLKELKSNEAVLAIAVAKITLRRAGRNVELGTIPNIAPLASAIADGIADGLGE